MPNATVPNVVCYSLRSCQPQRLITCACMHTTRRQASLLALYTHDSSWHAAQCAYVGQGWAWLPKRKPPAGPVAPPVSCQHTIALPPGPDNILGTRRAHARRPPQATLQGQIRRPKMRLIFRAFGPESEPWAHLLVQFGGPRLVPSSRPRRKKKAAPLGLFRSPHKGIRQDAQRQCQSGPRWSTRPGMASGSSRGSGGSGASASSEVLEALEALEALKALEALEALESLEPLLGPTVNFASA